MRLLMTAFGAFPTAPFNPTEKILSLLARRWRWRFQQNGVALQVARLPVSYALAPILDALFDRAQPDVTIMLGLAGRRQSIGVETRARNRASILRPDACGRVAPRLNLQRMGPMHRRSPCPLPSLAAALCACAIPAELSNDAGDYICNASYWRALERGPAVFIHIPSAQWAPVEKTAAALAQVLPHWSAKVFRP